MGWIYKIICIKNNKIYIGKTEYINPYKRWVRHCNDYKRNKYEKRPLYNAMNKYGVENFEFEPIEEINDSDELCKRESYWINKLRTYVGFDDCNGYNATLGGDGKPYLKLDEQEVIYYFTKTYSVNGVAKQFNVDGNTIKKILDKNNIKTLNVQEMVQYKRDNGTTICKLDLNNKLIETYNSFASANIAMGKHRKSSVIRMAVYKQHQGIDRISYGYKWMYYEDYIKLNQLKEIE